MIRGVLLAILIGLLGAFAPGMALAADTPATTQAAVRFVTIDLTLDTQNQPLAAWQVELKAIRGDLKIVGVEGGDHHDVYRDPPYYDPAALAGGRIILASYTTSATPPQGTLVVARIHARISGEIELNTKLVAAANPAGEPIPASASAKVKD